MVIIRGLCVHSARIVSCNSTGGTSLVHPWGFHQGHQGQYLVRQHSRHDIAQSVHPPSRKCW